MNNDIYPDILVWLFSFSKTQVDTECEEKFFFVITTHEQLHVGMALLSHIIKLKGIEWNK